MTMETRHGLQKVFDEVTEFILLSAEDRICCYLVHFYTYQFQYEEGH
jgi:hypothetical protein